MTPKLLEDERAEDAIAQRIADKSDSDAPENAQGLTFQEWAEAAGWAHWRDPSTAKAPWILGEDPSEYRADPLGAAFRHAAR